MLFYVVVLVLVIDPKKIPLKFGQNQVFLELSKDMHQGSIITFKIRGHLEVKASIRHS